MPWRRQAFQSNTNPNPQQSSVTTELMAEMASKYGLCVCMKPTIESIFFSSCAYSDSQQCKWTTDLGFFARTGRTNYDMLGRQAMALVGTSGSQSKPL